MRQNDLFTARARDLRQQMTRAEHTLWFALRDRRFMGLKFRRQVPLGPYIADFLCAERRLIVEAVGGQQADSVRDGARDAWLAAQGFTTLRLRNADILGDLPFCLQRLAERLAR